MTLIRKTLSLVICLSLLPTCFLMPYAKAEGIESDSTSAILCAADEDYESDEDGEPNEGGEQSGENEGEETEQEELTLDLIRTVRFDDVAETDRFCDAISYIAYRGAFRGCGSNRFCPDGYMTRGQLIAVLHRLNSILDDGRDGAGDDIQWAVDAGILLGTTDGTYDKTACITREQAAAMLCRFGEYRGVVIDCSGDLSAYSDAPFVSDYARIPVSWATERGIFRSIVQDSFCPALVVSREQAAAMMTALIAAITAEPVAIQITEANAQAPFISASRANHAQIQSYVDSVAKKYGASGLQVSVIENGHVTDSFAYGWATRRSDPMTADHKMRVASISKVIIGMNVMRMLEDGAVDLDTQIGKYWNANFKNPYYPDKPVNIRGILTHTSSIIALEASSAYSSASVRQRQQNSSGYSHTVPGSLGSWCYNNYAFGVLGMTLELAANQTLDQMLHLYFFDTLGIDAAFYAGDIKDTSLLVTLSGHDGSVQRSLSTQKSLHAGTPGSSGSAFAGGLTISAKDLAKMAAVLASDGEYEGVKMLSPDSVALMESYEQKTVSDGFHQALPLRHKTGIYGRDALYYHTGSAYGVYNCMSYDPVSGDGVVVLSVGASAAKDKYSIYAVCGNISDYIYRTIER